MGFGHVSNDRDVAGEQRGRTLGEGGGGFVKGAGEGTRGEHTSQRVDQQSQVNQPEITREGGQRRGKTTNGNMSDAGDRDVLL